MVDEQFSGPERSFKGWNKMSIEQRAKFVSSNFGEYPIQVVDSTFRVCELRPFARDLLRNNGLKFVVYQEKDTSLAIARAAGDTHLNLDYARVHKFFHESPSSESVVYYVARSGGEIEVKINNSSFEADLPSLFDPGVDILRR